jgi:hypothetical protein
VPSSRLLLTSCLFSHTHQTPVQPPPALFRAREEGPLGTSALPRSDTSGHLGEISLDRCLRFLPRCCGRHHLPLRFPHSFRQPSNQLLLFSVVRARIRPASTCDPLQLVNFEENRHGLCPCGFENSTARGRSHTTNAQLSDDLCLLPYDLSPALRSRRSSCAIRTATAYFWLCFLFRRLLLTSHFKLSGSIMPP